MKILMVATLGFLWGCNNDVDQLMLKGEPGEYKFTNAELSNRFVDESLVHRFQVTSNYQGSKAQLECVYLGDLGLISQDTIILYLHGNAPNMDDYWQRAADFANIGGQHRFGVMMFDYRGFGNSEGKTEHIKTMLADVDACMLWLKEHGLTQDRLLLYGHSLGTMPAAEANAFSDVMRTPWMVLEAPQTTDDVLLQDATGSLSLSATYVTDFGYDIPSALGEFQKHFLWIHGTADDVASYPNMLHVYEGYKNPLKDAVIVEGAGHEVVDEMGFEPWESKMLELLRK
ncbi:alpha/beta fold hydrolase [bacterium SCSIO 12741]|nr:alpha/beta fold hydrolase [bacterium SCSIO 12741]